MATPAAGPREVHLDALENYLISMTRSVERSTGKVFHLLLDQDRVPRDEFLIRQNALNATMDAQGLKAMLIYGDAAEHSVLAWFSNFAPRLRRVVNVCETSDRFHLVVWTHP